MSKVSDVLKNNKESVIGIDAENIKIAFERRFLELGIDDLYVDEVEIELDGFITVLFSDGIDFELEVIFYVDQDGKIVVSVPDDNDEVIEYDITDLLPVVRDTVLGPFVSLTTLGWIDLSFLQFLFSDEIEPEVNKTIIDKYGHTLPERKIAVIRNGKKVKIDIKRKRRKKRLTPAQKKGIKVAARKRKQKKNQSNRKRKISNKARSRQKLKTKPKGFKVGK